MATVSVNPPKTPVTTGSNGLAAATVPNVCKMPGPPAPFVPTPLPNIGKSNSSPKKYTKDVKVEKKPVAVKGASFTSKGDMGSKGTGGGLVSSNTHGPTKFVGPGSLDVKFEGKNVHLLGDPMMNDCGPSGSPANSATLAGLVQQPRPKFGDACLCATTRRVPAEGEETRSTEELARSLDDEATRLDQLAAEALNAAAAESDLATRTKMHSEAIDRRKGAAHKRFEAHVARDTNAREVSVQIYCADQCGRKLGEFDVVTGSGVIKEVKSSGQAVEVPQLYNEMRLAPSGAVVHLAVPGDGKQRAAALKRFVRSGGRKMTNKGAGYNRLIQEH